MAKLNVRLFGFNVSAEISKSKTSDEINREMSRAMADSIKKIVIDVTRKEKRQGGLLRDP